MSKQSIVIKNQKKMKVSLIELGPYLNQEFGFIDPDFPHVYSSINENDIPPNQEIQWIAAQYLQQHSNYSDDITNLQTSLFHKKSISHSLIIINWFENSVFSEIFLKDLSDIHLYSYFVMVDGVFMHMPIDSYIPVNSKTRETLFTPKSKGSIFPCLYEKLLAKIYGDYYSITSEFIDIVELQTLFCRQEISLTCNIKKQDLISILKSKIESKSIVSFRTRNSIRLESLGLESNYVYIILRVMQKEDDTIIQFLELDGQSWIGKHSKLRSVWQLQESFVINNEIIRTEQYKQNYMSLEDMKGIGRQLIILNNTTNYHKNFYSSQKSANYFTMFKIKLNQVNNCMIRVNFKHKKCYNGVYIIKKVGLTNKLISSRFNENKSSTYLQSSLQPGQYNIIIYNTHSQQQCLPFNLTLYSSEQFVDIVPLSNHPEILQVLQSCFLTYFSEKCTSNNEGIVFKQLYNLTGFAFIYLKPNQHPLTIVINSQLLEERKIFCLNYKTAEKQLALTFPIAKQGLIIYKCLWSKKQNIDFDTEDINSRQQIEKISFPPAGSIKVFQKIKK